MKSSSASVTAAAAFTLLVAASTAVAAPTRRDNSVSCTSKYHGPLYSASEVNGGTNAGSNYLTQVGDNALAIAQYDFREPVQFHFDTCSSDGWNTDDGREFGQVKADTLGDYQCLTASDDDQHVLSFQPCSSAGDDVLARQWFYANYQTDVNDFGTTVTLSLRGNPNDASTSEWDLPRIAKVDENSPNSTFKAEPASPDFSFSLVMSPVTIIS